MYENKLVINCILFMIFRVDLVVYIYLQSHKICFSHVVSLKLVTAINKTIILWVSKMNNQPGMCVCSVST